MDFDQWKWPAVGGFSFWGLIFGYLNIKRRKSGDGVLDAMDTTSKVYVSDVIAKWQEAEKLAKTNFDLYVIELRRADALQAQVNVLEGSVGNLLEQVRRLTKIVINDHPEFREVLRRTGFGELDSHGTTP